MKAIIFDLDGVLINTDELHYLAWKNLADKLGVYFDRTINCRLRGVSREESLDIILKNSPRQYKDTEKSEFCNYKNRLYRGFLEKLSPNDVSPIVVDTLQKLKSKGFLLAVGSSSKNTPLILSKTKLRLYFDAVCDGNMIEKSKPDPEVFLLAAKKLSVTKESCYVVEDAAKGIAAAKAALMTAIGIGDYVDQSICDYKIHSLDQLLHICKYGD